MPEKLLINVSVEETRVALVESGRIRNLEIDTQRLDQAKGNIYKGIVHRVNPSLQAAFVDYGADKQGFLPVSEIHPRYYPEALRGQRVPIQQVLREGQELMVQVLKDEIGNKGAGLSSYISLPGRYLVLMAETDKTRTSRRLPSGERVKLKKIIDGLPVPEGFGIIVRTAARDGREEEEISSDLEFLKRLWATLEERFAQRKDAGLIHQERSIALRFIRDYAASGVDEIIVDDFDTYEEIRDFCTILVPELQPRVRLYDDPQPVFSRYQIEDQIDDIFARRIDLPSGGHIIIDQAEALVAIDVNSGRVKTDDIEDTALKTNVEAAEEVARQLKIRDLGGLIVIDFIDMRDKENNKKVEQVTRDAFADDKAKVKFSRISAFGLLEISRQRLKTSITKGSFESCPHCGGLGQLRSVESSALYVLRRLKETVIRGNYMHATVRVPVAVANYILNCKRGDLVEVETETQTTLEVRGEEDCPPMRGYVDLLTHATKGKRPRRILQTFDLVRSEIDRREMDETEELVMSAAGARDISLSSDDYQELYRAIEREMARDAAQTLIDRRERIEEEQSKREDERREDEERRRDSQRRREAEIQRREADARRREEAAARREEKAREIIQHGPVRKPGFFARLAYLFTGTWPGGSPEQELPKIELKPEPEPEPAKRPVRPQRAEAEREGARSRSAGSGRSSDERSASGRGGQSKSSSKRSSNQDRSARNQSRSAGRSAQGRSGPATQDKGAAGDEQAQPQPKRDKPRSERSGGQRRDGRAPEPGGEDRAAQNQDDKSEDAASDAIKKRRRRRRRRKPAEGGDGAQAPANGGEASQAEAPKADKDRAVAPKAEAPRRERAPKKQADAGEKPAAPARDSAPMSDAPDRKEAATPKAEAKVKAPVPRPGGVVDLRGGGAPAPKPKIAPKPKAVAPEPKPAPESAARLEKPQPKVEAPAPRPAPAAEKPKPKVEAPAPKPAPAADTPKAAAPVAKAEVPKPKPAVSVAAPKAEAPAPKPRPPAARKPAPTPAASRPVAPAPPATPKTEG